MDCDTCPSRAARLHAQRSHPRSSNLLAQCFTQLTPRWKMKTVSTAGIDAIQRVEAGHACQVPIHRHAARPWPSMTRAISGCWRTWPVRSRAARSQLDVRGEHSPARRIASLTNPAAHGTRSAAARSSRAAPRGSAAPSSSALQRAGAQVLAVARTRSPRIFHPSSSRQRTSRPKPVRCRRPMRRASGSAASTSSCTWPADRMRRPEASPRCRTRTGGRRWS